MKGKMDKIFVNLPVKDLTKSTAFFTKLGFELNPKFSDQNATCVVFGENIFAMLIVEDLFNTFTNKDISDATKSTEVIVTLSVDSRKTINEIVNKAFAAGGKPAMEPMDQDWAYAWSFQDLDGHQWEMLYMDESAMPKV